MSASGPRLRLIETSPDRAVTRLHQIVRQRDVLRVDFRRTWDSIAADAADAELEAWAASALEIALVNAGPACLLAFWRVSVELRATLGVPVLAGVGRASAAVCCHPGSDGALSRPQGRGPAGRPPRHAAPARRRVSGPRQL